MISIVEKRKSKTEREQEREETKTQVTDTIKIYGMRGLGMEEKKEGRRKTAKEVDYNLMLLHAQKLQVGAECQSLGWGLLVLGWAGVGRPGGGGTGLLYFFGEERVLSEMPLEECAGMIYSPQDELPGRTVPALVWLARPQHRGTPSGAGQGGQPAPSPGLCPPREWLLGQMGSEKQRGEIKIGLEQHQSAMERCPPPPKHFH